MKNLFRSRVVKNFSYLTVASAISQVVSLFTLLKIAHLISPAEYGFFSFLIAQGTLLFTVGDLGLKNVVIRSIARNPLRTNDLLFSASILRFTGLAVITIVYLSYNLVFGKLTHVEIILIFIFSFFNSFSNLFENVFFGREKMLPPSIVNFGYSVLWLGSVYLTSTGTTNTTFLFYIVIGLTFAKAVMYFILLRSHQFLIGPITRFKTSAKQLLQESWPFFIMILIMLPITSLSNNFLDLNSTIEEVGYFNLSQKLMGPVSLTMTIALTVIFPNLSSLWVKDQPKFYHYVSVGFKSFMLLISILCFVFSLFAREIFSLLFPTDYLSAVKVCQMQIWYLFLTSVDSLIGTILAATNREKLILRFGILYCLVCTPLFYYFSKSGALGLAYGYVISFAVCLIYVWHMFKKSLRIQIVHSSIIWVVAGILFLITYMLPLNFPLLYKLLFLFVVVGGAAPYFFKTYKVLVSR